MDRVIIGFIIGYLVRLLIAIWFDEHQTNKEFRKAKIEVDLDKCCENAYNYGYEIGRLEEQVRSDRKLKELYERQQAFISKLLRMQEVANIIKGENNDN